MQKILIKSPPPKKNIYIFIYLYIAISLYGSIMSHELWKQQQNLFLKLILGKVSFILRSTGVCVCVHLCVSHTQTRLTQVNIHIHYMLRFPLIKFWWADWRSNPWNTLNWAVSPWRWCSEPRWRRRASEMSEFMMWPLHSLSICFSFWQGPNREW